jgi:hypothetical protein
MARDAYFHSKERGGCSFTTVIPERIRASFLASIEPLKDGETRGLRKTAHCAHCWRDVPVGELKWADGERVGA